ERGEVELVVEHRQGVHLELVEPHGFADRSAALVHEGRRLEQQNLVTGDTAFLQPALELLLGRREAVHLGNDVERHEADIVPVHRILRTGISKTNPELHGGALSESWRQAQALRAASYRLAPSRPA